MDEDDEVRLAAVRVLAKVAPTQDRESADVLLHLILTDMSEGARRPLYLAIRQCDIRKLS
jgi:hypothetical protein